jgi:hypothetical protein
MRIISLFLYLTALWKKENKFLDGFLSVAIVLHMETKKMYKELVEKLSLTLERSKEENLEIRKRIGDLDKERNDLIKRLNDNSIEEKRITNILSLIGNGNSVEEKVEDKPTAETAWLHGFLRDIESVTKQIENQKHHNTNSFFFDPTKLTIRM